MKKNSRRLSIFWMFFISLFISNHTKASSQKDITTRINKVRKTLQDKAQTNNLLELTGREFNKELNEWVNWGNWANWNNWNNWANWANWNNWRNG